MGLREKKAERNRERIIHEALLLFGNRGFDQTTMEQIAEAAEVSPSTLYRYFPSKDLIVLARFVTQAQRLPGIFQSFALDIPLPEVLAKTILAALSETDEPSSQSILIRSILDQNPEARARLWDMLDDLRNQLGKGIAARLKLPPDDIRVIMTARLTIMVAETAADIWRAHPKRRSTSLIAQDILHFLATSAIVVPSLGSQDVVSTPEAKSTQRSRKTT